MELEHLRSRDEQWKEGLTKAVGELKTGRENYSNLEELYSSLKEENKKITETREWAFNLGRGMNEEYCVLYYKYMLLLKFAYWIQSGWNLSRSRGRKSHTSQPCRRISSI